MNTDLILHKYMRHLRIMNGGYISLDAVELALRLALDELAESTPSTPSISSMPLLQTAGYDALAEQLIRLNNWCAHHAPAALNGPGSTADVVLAVLDSYAQQIDRQAEELRQAADPASHDDRIAALKANLKAVDADNALLRSQLDAMRDAAQSLAEDKRNLQTEFSSLSGQLAQLDTDNVALIRRNKKLADELRTLNSNAVAVISGVVGAGLPNGYVRPSTDNNQQSPANNSLWEDPDKLIFLDDEAKDWWIGMSSGRHAWRSVPKSMQLRMVRQVLGHHDGDGPVRMIDFDAIKPDWMPSANSHTKTLGLSWQQLNDWSIEL